MEIHRDLGLPAAAWRWNTEALTPTNTFARSHGLRLTVLACTHLQGQSPNPEAALDQGNRAVTSWPASPPDELPTTPATYSTGRSDGSLNPVSPTCPTASATNSPPRDPPG